MRHTYHVTIYAAAAADVVEQAHEAGVAYFGHRPFEVTDITADRDIGGGVHADVTLQAVTP